MMKLILLGAPGAGKGTQAELISTRFGIPTVGTGNMIREALKQGTEMGLKAKAYMESGALVPDEVVIGIVRERIAKEDCKNGFILDGFPRTVPQAQALLDMGVEIDKVLEIDVADEEIEKRMTGRRVCESCGSSYHLVYNPPQRENICDKCGGSLIIRKDDEPQVVKDRLKTYHDITEPLKEFYERLHILVSVKGQEELEETTRLVMAALEA